MPVPEILVVDDEPLMRELVTDIIRVESLTTDDRLRTASNGKEALDLFKVKPADIVITDMKMPHLDGAGLSKGIREISTSTEIIVVTAFADLEMALELIRVGVFEVVGKPFKLPEMKLALENVISKWRLRQENSEYRLRLIAAEKFTSMGIMAAGIAHEINNPVTYVKGNLELLLKCWDAVIPSLNMIPDTAPQKPAIDFAIQNVTDLTRSSIQGCDRITKIVSGLLNFSRNSSDEREEISFSELIDQTMGMLSHRIKSVRIERIGLESIPKIRVNIQELVQVLSNLLVNAVDAIESQKRSEPGLVRISATKKGNQITLDITDNGTGMSKEQTEKLFTPFFTTKPVGKGTGLGLSISRSLIEKNGGKIEVTSQVNVGTTFSISF